MNFKSCGARSIVYCNRPTDEVRAMLWKVCLLKSVGGLLARGDVEDVRAVVRR